MGGETGSNASPQPNLEILPKPVGGDTVVPLDWLARTDPNNLYPFVIILPSTHLFIGKKLELRKMPSPISVQVITTKRESWIPSPSTPLFNYRIFLVRLTIVGVLVVILPLNDTLITPY